MTERTDGGLVIDAPDEAPTDDAAHRTNEYSRRGTRFHGEDLVVGYSTSDDPVIDGLSIEAVAGQVTALVGPNGSGKSTVLKGLANQLSIDAGTVLLDGREIHDLEPKELARRLGHLEQENDSPESLTVEKLISHGRYPYRGFLDQFSEDDLEAIDRAIELAGVSHLRDRDVGTLSGGQKQLVWIAMALAQDTDVLLLDEPTTFLDMHHQLEVMEIIETLRDESDMTIIVILHDLQQAACHADHVIALQDGSVYASGHPWEVVTEDLLADVFRIKADVSQGANGPQITPLRPLHED